jgi:Double zinc ribbon
LSSQSTGAPSIRSAQVIRFAVRALTLAAGALLIVGVLRPWAFVPLGGFRLPLYGALGWGGLAGVAGLILLLHPRPAPGTLLGIAAGAAYLAYTIPLQLLDHARATTHAIDSWLDPMNQLLDRFHIEGLHLTEWSLPAAHAMGPGATLTLWGAALAAAAAGLSPLSRTLTPPGSGLHRACPACAVPLSPHRELRFCPACGASLTALPFCRVCRALAEPGDRFCGCCGLELG